MPLHRLTMSKKLFDDPRKAVQVLHRILRGQRVSQKMVRSALANIYGDSDPELATPVFTEHDVLLAFASLCEEMDDRPAIHDVAARVGFANSTTSCKLASLERKGFLGRHVKLAQVPRNYKLTAKGLEYIANNTE